jgi:hypothetical protein
MLIASSTWIINIYCIHFYDWLNLQHTKGNCLSKIVIDLCHEVKPITLPLEKNNKNQEEGRWFAGNKRKVPAGQKKVWEGITVYPRLFGMNISSWCTYFALQIRHGISHSTHQIRPADPTTGNLHTLARSSQACSVTHRRGISPSPKCLKCKRSKFWAILFS